MGSQTGFPSFPTCSGANGDDTWDYCDPAAEPLTPTYYATSTFSTTSFDQPPYGWDSVSLTHGGSLWLAIQPVLTVTVQTFVPGW